VTLPAALTVWNAMLPTVIGEEPPAVPVVEGAGLWTIALRSLSAPGH